MGRAYHGLCAGRPAGRDPDPAGCDPYYEKDACEQHLRRRGVAGRRRDLYRRHRVPVRGTGAL